MKHFISMIFPSCFCLFMGGAAVAQQDEPEVQRIIEVRSTEGESQLNGDPSKRLEALMARGQTERISIAVPGFREGDDEKYRYFISRFSETGGGYSSSSVDKNGILQGRVRYRISEGGRTEPAEHFYIFSQNYATGENRYSFNLENFPLMGFVRSLGSSQRRFSSSRTIESSPTLEGILRAEATDPIYADIIVPSLQGENLTFEQVLDLLRRESGCDVIQAEGKLVIDWCG